MLSYQRILLSFLIFINIATTTANNNIQNIRMEIIQAIRNCNANKVEKILEENQFSNSELLGYIKIASEVAAICRDNINIESIKPSSSPLGTLAFSGSLLSGIMAITMFIGAKHNISHQHHPDLSPLGAAIILSISSIALFKKFIDIEGKYIKEINNCLKNNMDNILYIQQILHSYIK